MFLGDLFLGFHNTMFFTYLSLAIVVLVGLYLKSLKFTNILYGTLASSIVFFIITNFSPMLNLVMRKTCLKKITQHLLLYLKVKMVTELHFLGKI